MIGCPSINRVVAALAIGVSICVPGSISIADDAPVTLEKITDAWKAREQKIKSFDFRWWSKHFEVEPSDPQPQLEVAKAPARPETTFIIMRRFATDTKDDQLRMRLDERGRRWRPDRSDFVPSSTVEILDHGVERQFDEQSPLGYPLVQAKAQVGLIDYHDIRSRPLRLAYRPLHSPIGVFPGQMTLGKAADEGLVVLEHP